MIVCESVLYTAHACLHDALNARAFVCVYGFMSVYSNLCSSVRDLLFLFWLKLAFLFVCIPYVCMCMFVLIIQSFTYVCECVCVCLWAGLDRAWEQVRQRH